jgi:transcriptional regulator with XRE-family HTH domain
LDAPFFAAITAISGTLPPYVAYAKIECHASNMEAIEGGKKRRSNDLGPTGRAVAANLVRLRKARGLSTTQLSRALADVDRPIPPTGITKIEAGDRRVDADDLVALAVVLGVNPSALLLPVDVEPDDPISVTGWGEAAAREAWHWVEGRSPLHRPAEPSVASGRAMYQARRMYDQGRPYWLVEAEGDD